MTTLTEPDTVDDWRSEQRLPACRVTAAGITRESLERQSGILFQALFDAGWTRTPDPMDAPNESSMRFRRGDTDCLFNLYGGILLGTAAELEVSRARIPGAGERRYHVLVQCIPALPAR